VTGAVAWAVYPHSVSERSCLANASIERLESHEYVLAQRGTYTQKLPDFKRRAIVQREREANTALRRHSAAPDTRSIMLLQLNPGHTPPTTPRLAHSASFTSVHFAGFEAHPLIQRVQHSHRPRLGRPNVHRCLASLWRRRLGGETVFVTYGKERSGAPLLSKGNRRVADIPVSTSWSTL
jgi:hypothetical protein